MGILLSKPKKMDISDEELQAAQEYTERTLGTRPDMREVSPARFSRATSSMSHRIRARAVAQGSLNTESIARDVGSYGGRSSVRVRDYRYRGGTDPRRIKRMAEKGREY